MTFNFDEHTDRYHSDSIKWNHWPPSVLPMWVADTDFRSPPCVIEALQARVAQGVFGYGKHPDGLAEAVVNWLANRYDWHIEPEWLVFIPGVATGLNLAVRAYCGPDQGTLAPDPIYPPFRKAARLAGHTQLNAPLHLQNDRWVMNLEEIEPQLLGNERLLMLCNPQNPGGTVYRRNELSEQLAFAQRNNLIVCSDEIHCDLLLDEGAHHIPFASLSDDAAQRTVTLMAPSKTWNIAGLGASFAIIANPVLRQRFVATRAGIVPEVDILAITAAEAALREGGSWLDAQLQVLRNNRDTLCAAINALPGLAVIPPEGTFLAWVDCSGLPVDNPAKFFLDAGLGFSPGRDFGNSSFVRINFGCTQETLNEAILRIQRAVNAL
ncbi:MalY/PatB family protein [Mangrovibacter phragmitis]|uniref:MalY/PatB family protein n=1 Tax=Mangrovibacter phragmitis TaxID=1691903 RepID=UPI0035117095